MVRFVRSRRLQLIVVSAALLAVAAVVLDRGLPATRQAPLATLRLAARISRPDAFVRVDQLAVVAGRPFRARVLSRSSETHAPFDVLGAGGETVARGRVGRELGGWNARFRHVAAVTVPRLQAGIYVVRVGGRHPAASPPVHVGWPAALVTPTVRDAVAFFSTQRDGADVAGAELPRAPSHLADGRAWSYAAPAYRRGRLASALRRLPLAPVDVSGGWADAGDYLKFFETASFATALQLVTARDDGAALGASTRDALVAEARHGADWLLKMYDPQRRVLRYQVGIGDGGHGVTGAHDANWGLPQRDDARNERPGDRGFFLEYRPAFVAGPAGAPLSPNLAGRGAAALALAAQVLRTPDPAYAARCLAAAKALFAQARTTRVGRLLTASPYAYYPEAEWRDDLEFGAAELARASFDTGDAPAGRRYLATAARWADAVMRSPLNGSDTFNLYDVSALGHLEVGRLMAQTHAAGLAVEAGDLTGDLGDQLTAASRHAARDPFGAGVPLGDGDTVPHAFGLSIEASAFDELAHSQRFAAFGQAQLDWALGANPWGMSFVVGAGSRFPFCVHHQVANLEGSLTGGSPLLRGATVAGPGAPGDLTGLGVPDGTRRCPQGGGDPMAQFTGRGGRYEDAVSASATNEPTDDATALALTALAGWVRRG